jgi:hypothetical protein
MMKVKGGLLAGVVALTLFALAPSAIAGAHDFAVGGGQHDDLAGTCSNSTNDCVDEGFAAHSDSTGGNPRGHVSATVPHVGKLTGPVTCLHVTGNEALIVFVQTKNFPGSLPGLSSACTSSTTETRSRVRRRTASATIPTFHRSSTRSRASRPFCRRFRWSGATSA